MFKTIQITLSLIVFFIFTNHSIAQIQKSTPEKISNQVIVRMQPGLNAHKLSREIDPNYGLNIVKVLSQHTDIWLLNFNEDNVDKEQVLNALNRLDDVLYAQPNRTVKLRAAPNDPDFGNQWQYDNIEAQDAWDITTGGTTPNGTEIVVALIESADLINHEDLKDNQWVNTAEIPNNGIDDDGNGYIDDYNGWNVGSDNDDIGTGSHGTSCAGMIGAKGNNGIGVTGINWDVKIMDIAGHNNPFTEANIIEAYNYALQARLLWNQTQGAQGAFVVVTSASWGVDNGNPDDYPIWCSFYEDLGAAGILNCGATTNSHNDVDVVGDVPTACSSDYMISVTATDQSDIIDFAGYGQTTIDVAAPGSSIYTTSSNNGYGSTSGTSFATPLTAGLIGLMYSAPCKGLEAMAKAAPQITADIVRQSLFDAVDENGYLATRTVTGGRINAKRAIDTLMVRICNTCLPPSNITTDSISNDQTSIYYNKLSDTSSYNIYIRVADTGTWVNYTTTDTTFLFTNLDSCTQYEYTVLADCNNDGPNSTGNHTFTTFGCGNCIDLNYCEAKAENPGSTFYVKAPSSIEGTYSIVPTGNFGGNINSGYAYGELVLVNDGSAAPEEGCNTLTNVLEVNGNIAVIMRGNCPFVDKVMNAQDAGATAAIIINNVSSAPFEMGGTNSNITIPAVMISQSDGNTLLAPINNGDHPIALLGQQNEWIASFEINGHQFSTGDNDGYIFTSNSLTLTLGETYPFSITPGFDGAPLEEYYRIWLDLDQEGSFSQSDLIYDSGSPDGNPLSDVLTIPSSAKLGNTRMRVQMAFQGFDNITLPGYCGNYFSGEVEDYCVTINDDDVLELSKEKVKDGITIYPNPSKDQIFIEKSSDAKEIKIYNPKGQLINQSKLLQDVTTIDVKNWASGIYFVHLFDKEGGIITIEKLSVIP